METVTLFCLPYAGGDEFAYWRWADLLAGTATVHAVGRDTPLSVGAVTDLISATTGPFAIYGHSMGARLGFEVVRELRRRGAPLPLRLYVGGAHPPHLREPIARVAHLDVDGFIDQLILRADTPAAVRDDPDVREALVPALAADLAWLQAYRFTPAPPLPVPVVAFAATHDNEVPGDLALGWARHTSAWFRYHTLAADHLFVGAQAPRVTALIAADLVAARGGVAASGRVASRSRSEVIRTVAPGREELDVWRLEGAPDADKARRLVLDRYTDLPGCPVVVANSGGTTLVAIGPAVRGLAVERVRPVDVDAVCAGLDPAERAAVLGEPEEDQARLALLARAAADCFHNNMSDSDGSDPHYQTRCRRLDLDSAVAAVALAVGTGPLRLRYETITGDAR